MVFVLRKVIRRPYKGVVTRWNSDFEEVRHTNIYMGDLQEALARMLDPEFGIDKSLLKDSNGDEVDPNCLMFMPNERVSLRQYECASEPVMKLSHFFQHSVPMAHMILVTIRARIEEMRQSHFQLYGDLSYSENLAVLTNRVKNETISSEAKDPSLPMNKEIYMFRKLFADDFELRCGLVYVEKENDQEVTYNVARLPKDIAIACLLNPLVGGKITCSFATSKHFLSFY
jgi:hypothetical protein